MVYAQRPSLVRNLGVEDLSLDGRARDLDAGRPEQRMDIPSNTTPIGLPQSAGRKDSQARNRPSAGGRMFRGLTRFIIAVLIGVGGTLAWQSYGDVAREMLATRAPGLAALLPPVMKSAADAASPASMDQLAPIASNLASSLEIVRRSLDQMAARQDQMAQTIAALQAADEETGSGSCPPLRCSSPPPSCSPDPSCQPAAQSAAAPRRPPPAAAPAPR